MKTKVYDLRTQYEEGIKAAAEEIRQGRLAIFPTETVYGLGADAFCPEAVRKIFEAKGRPQDNPLIVHISDFSQLAQIASDVSDMARRLMERFWPGPFTAVLRKKPGLPDEVTAGLDTVGVRMPASRAARDLIRESGCPIAAPSANLSGRPSPTRFAHALADFDGKVAVILDGGACGVGVESTVCGLTGEAPEIFRPGGITPEMIRDVAGSVHVADAVLHGVKPGERVASPGMKYKHYAPRAKVTIVDGENAKTIAFKLNSMYDIEEKKGASCLILCPDASAPRYGERRVWPIGKDESEVARQIFDALRRADEAHIDHIFFEAVAAQGIGLAVMNRMIRAAGFEVI